MRWLVALPCALALWGCSSGDSGGVAPDAGKDVSTNDVTAPDVATHDTGTNDTGSGDTGSQNDAQGDTGTSDAGCPAAWLAEPTVDTSIAVPADGGTVMIHVSANGTQNYACTVASDGGTGWTFVGPQATLDDCTGALFGHHFASDGGATFPEWQATDGTYVVGHKKNAYDAGAESVPWLLLTVVGQGGSGQLAQATYVQRLNTDGGATPTSACDAGATESVGYTADYYFYGP
jgi:hypothetical protein